MRQKLFAMGFLLILAVPAFGQEWEEVTTSTMVFQEGYIQVVGESEQGQTRYQAKRSAEVLAQRRLLETVQGLRLAGVTDVHNGMLASEMVKTSVGGIVRGAISCGEKFFKDEGYAQVCLRMSLRGKGSLFEGLYPAIKDDPKALNLPQGQEFTPTQAAVSAPEPMVYDGIIIDVRQYSFRPALVNRVLTEKKEVLFEPSKVLSNVLIDRGCGGYTTDVSKAKALLASWGSSTPLTVEGQSVSNFTDVMVNGETANAIFTSDQESNILAQARVVFVLK